MIVLFTRAYILYCYLLSAIREKDVAENSSAIAEQMLVKSFGMSSVIPTKSTTSAGMHHLL